MRDLARNAAVERDHVNLLRPGVLLEIDGLDGEGDQLAIGRQRGLADARELEHGLDVEGAFLSQRETSCADQKQEGTHLTTILTVRRELQISNRSPTRAAKPGSSAGSSKESSAERMAGCAP